MKICVTGSTGLVGSNLITRLEKSKKHKIIGLSRKEGMDLSNETVIHGFFQVTRPEVVFHLAANASEARGQMSPIDMTERNMMIFINTLTAAINAGVKKFVYTSSVAVYGQATVPYKEDGKTIPKDVYGVNKLACEQILKIMAKVYKFKYVILRPHNIYGPGQNMNDPSKNVVALFMRRLMEGQQYNLYGQGKMRRAFSYVDDVVDVLYACLTKKLDNQTLNVGSDYNISVKELSDLIQKITGIEIQPFLAPSRPQEISMFLADHSLQNKLLKYKDTPLYVGLEKTWEWAKKKDLGELEFHKKEINV